MLQPLPYQMPVYGQPHYVTVVNPYAYQSSYIYNPIFPSVVYEPKTAGQLLASNIPLLSSVQRLPLPHNYDPLYNQACCNAGFSNPPCLPPQSFEEGVEKCTEKLANLSCGQCHEQQPTSMNLDERIQLIRQELNLPSEREQNKLISKLDAERKRHEQMGFFTDDRSECASRLSDVEPREHRSRSKSVDREKGCAKFRSRSRSFDERVRAESEARSRSRSASRCGRMSAKPIWMPTGNNDFTRTVEKRNKMIVQQEKRQYMLDSLDTLNRNKVFDKPTRVSTAFPSLNRNPSFLNSFELEKPRPTKQRTAESFDYNSTSSQQKPTQSQIEAPTTYIRATFAPVPEKRPETTRVTYVQPVYYEKNVFPKESFVSSQNKANTGSFYNLRPVAATNGGAIYTCSNKNELHYVSNNARNTVQICTSKNDYKKNFNNMTRIVKSDTTVIHD